MRNSVIIENIRLQLNRDMIFHRIDCYPDSPVYEDVVEMYDLLTPWVMEHIFAKAVIAWEPSGVDEFVELKDFNGVMYLITTIGSDIEQRSTLEFKEGDYLAGMLLDAMADDLLFQIEDNVKSDLQKFCAQLKKGVSKRLEAPRDIAMDIQKRALDVCGVEKSWNMRITSGLMYSPVKSNCVVLGLTDDTDIFNAQHDCSKCSAKNCKMRKC